ncbi:Flagellar FliJ protein [Ferriphaselus amnicola]|uniref:Flagellar FliJ protein n=1 Tax=Ferriphaselus amnicola TaxID=1188319 RepID=A0A2Z6GDJ1_9PROT|nr:flagellar export protein FliJ [Ferriphaselus amnicola]BBE51527.1 Flagellar FliJ protein [Ferriphaselus amnicola]
MTKPFTLQPLVNLAQQRNEAATKRLGQLNQQQQTAQDKLDALLLYRKDYQTKFQEAVKNGIEPAELRNFQEFIYRLDEAITQQRQVTSYAERSVQHGREDLMNAQVKMKSFDTLAQRHIEEGKRLEAKLEQKVQDEHAGRQAAYQKPHPEGE